LLSHAAQLQLDGVRLIADGLRPGDDRERALSADFDDHLIKPVDLATVERALGNLY